jgi:hypothetical protein
VERWFHLETILALPVPVVTLGDASDAVHQYPTGVAFREHSARLPRGRGVRFTAWCAIHDQTVLQASSETIAAFPPLRAAATSP